MEAIHLYFPSLYTAILVSLMMCEASKWKTCQTCFFVCDHWLLNYSYPNSYSFPNDLMAGWLEAGCFQSEEGLTAAASQWPLCTSHMQPLRFVLENKPRCWSSLKSILDTFYWGRGTHRHVSKEREPFPPPFAYGKFHSDKIRLAYLWHS
jgi:hypothetical protein